VEGNEGKKREGDRRSDEIIFPREAGAVSWSPPAVFVLFFSLVLFFLRLFVCIQFFSMHSRRDDE